MTRISHVSGNGRNQFPFIQLSLEVREPLLVGYFEPFVEPERSAKALEALKVGVIALQTACPTLDSQIVKDQFGEMQQDLGEALVQYFAEKDGIVPKSLADAFGDKGALSQVLQRYFDPKEGRFVRLMDGQIGPSSEFGQLFNPRNKDGVIAKIEEKVKRLVEEKLDDVLTEFSLDDDESAMSRLKTMIESAFTGRLARSTRRQGCSCRRGRPGPRQRLQFRGRPVRRGRGDGPAVRGRDGARSWDARHQ